MNLASLRTLRGLTLKALADMMIPPVRDSYIHMLEHGHSQASPATLMDLARIFGSIEIEDQFGHQYTLVYRGKSENPLNDSTEWP